MQQTDTQQTDTQQTDTQQTTPAQHGTSGVAAIARDTHQPLPLVQRLYAEEVGKLAPQARIKQFLDILALRRVRQRLRRH